jgi:hypothetical protein
LRHARKQKQTENKLARLLAADWIRSLQRSESLDDGRAPAPQPAAERSIERLAADRCALV